MTGPRPANALAGGDDDYNDGGDEPPREKR